MIVLASTHRRLEIQHWELEARYHLLLAKWNALIERINRKGGEEFLSGEGAPRLSREDIKRLLSLCHPDKHDGKPLAVEMTQKLLKLRAE